MIAYRCTGPQGTRFAEVHLRLVVYTPMKGPDTGKLKCVLQAMRARTPVAEDPLLVDYLTPLELVKAMSTSRQEGWDFEFDYALAALLDKQAMAKPSLAGFRKKFQSKECSRSKGLRANFPDLVV